MLVNSDDTANQAVRIVVGDMDMRSLKRSSTLSPGLFSDIDSYPAPTDLKDQSIVDIRPQTNRTRDSEFTLTTAEQFGRRNDNLTAAVKNENGLKRILISARINDNTLVISTLDSITAGGGTWVATGDATNLVANSDNYIKGNAALKYDLGSGGLTTAGIRNTTLTSFDITDYLTNSIFHYEYIASTTNLTSYTLRVGSSTGDYYQQTVTTTHEGTAFTQGWNLLRFDMSTATTVGTPTSTACTYAEIFMTKSALKINETGYRADHIWAKKGLVYEIVYYTEYGWQTSGGTYIQDSTLDTDFVIADSGEFEIIVQKAIEIAAAEVNEDDSELKASQRYTDMKDKYLTDNPSESKLIQTTYYNF